MWLQKKVSPHPTVWSNGSLDRDTESGVCGRLGQVDRFDDFPYPCGYFAGFSNRFQVLSSLSRELRCGTFRSPRIPFLLPLPPAAGSRRGFFEISGRFLGLWHGLW